MEKAPADETVGLLRALFDLAADHAVTLEVRDEAGREGGIGSIVVRVVSPAGEEILVEVRDSSPGGRSWISEGGLDLAYQGSEMRGDRQGPRERLLAAMGASFRTTMRRSGPELRAQLAKCLERASTSGDGERRHLGGESAGQRTEAAPAVRTGEIGRAPLPPVLQMALESFDEDDGGPVSEDGIATVGRFLDGFLEAQTIAAAFELGIIDALADNDLLSFEELRDRLDITARGLHLITGLLVGCGVLNLRGERFALSVAFRRALEHRGLLLTLLGLITPAAHDLIENASAFFRDPWEFVPRAHVIGLFNYSETDPERARVWVAALSQVTRYEAPACLRRHDFSQYRRVLDVGGNSGEFARQICARHPHVEATVFDLPVVCAVGAEYLAGKPGAERVSFVGGDMRNDPLPRGFDLVCFKSVLNDWGLEDVRLFLGKALAAVRPGGRVLIYEREAVDLRRGRFPFRQLAVLPYLSNLRSAGEYAALIEDIGFVEIETERIDLGMRFLLLTARRRGSQA